MTVVDSSDEILLDRYLGTNGHRGGDLDALDQLLERHRSLAARLAFRLLGNQSDADDAVQTAYCSILEASDRQRPQTSFRAWLLAAVAKACNRHLREHQQRVIGERIVAHESPANQVQSEELRSVVRHEVDQLPDRIRLPLWLVFSDGLSSSEVAEILSLPDRTVRDLVRQGLSRLRRTLAGRGVGAAAIPALLALPGNEQAAEVAAAGYGSASAVGSVGLSVLVAGLAIGLGSMWLDTTAHSVAVSTPPSDPTVQLKSAVVIEPEAPDILSRRIQVVLRRHHVHEAMEEINRVIGGALPWACSPSLVGEPRHGISHDGSPIIVRELLDRMAVESGCAWEMAHGHVRLFHAGEESESVIELARRMATDTVALEELSRIDSANPYDLKSPRFMAGCASADPRAQAQLRLLLEQPDPPPAAIRLAGRWRCAWAVPILRSLGLRHPDKQQQRSVLTTKSVQRGFLVAEAEHVEHIEFSENAPIAALGSIATTEAVDALLAAFSMARDPVYRINVITALAITGDQRAWEVVFSSVSDPDVLTASQVVSAMANGTFAWDEQGSALRERSADLVEGIYRRQRGWNGIAASITLAQLGKPGLQRLIGIAREQYQDGTLSYAFESITDPREALPFLDGCWRVETHAAWALPLAVRGGDGDALAFALQAFRSAKTHNTAISEKLVSALVKTRNDGVIVDFLTCTDTRTPVDIRRMVASHVMLTRDPRADALVVQLTNDPDPGVRASALTHLSRKDRGLLGEHLAQDPDATVRRACIVALANSRQVEDAVTIAKSLTDSDPRIRHQAGHSLQAIVRSDKSTAMGDAVRPLVAAAAATQQEPTLAALLAQLLNDIQTPNVPKQADSP